MLRGHDGVRESAALLYRAIRNADRYVYENAQCEDRVALLEWRAEGRTSAIRDGVDSYLIEHGRIVAQTIHYTVVSRELSVTDLAGDDRPAADDRPAGTTVPGSKSWRGPPSRAGGPTAAQAALVAPELPSPTRKPVRQLG